MLVDNYKDMFKWFSTWAFIIIAYITAGPIPEDMVASIPAEYRGYVITVFAIVGLILRMVKQGSENSNTEV